MASRPTNGSTAGRAWTACGARGPGSPAAAPERPEDSEGADENTADVIPLKIFDARQEARKSW